MKSETRSWPYPKSGMTRQAIADALGVRCATVCRDISCTQTTTGRRCSGPTPWSVAIAGTYPVLRAVAPALDKVIDYLRDHPDATRSGW